jgi:hypothetical protein
MERSQPHFLGGQMNKIIERIERELGLPGLVSLLADHLAPTDLQSLLLEVFRRRAARRSPSDILEDYETDRFVRPAAESALRFQQWEAAAFSQLPVGFELLELSPICPLGTCSAIAPVDQNWAVSTVRNTEVVSDSSHVLALECALRRRQLLHDQPKSTVQVHLATSHRLVRGQHYQEPGLLSHFRVLALCSAGRDVGHMQFELEALALHVRFYVLALRAFLGHGLPIRLAASDVSGRDREAMVTSQLMQPLCDDLAIEGAWDHERMSGRGYYRDLCFHLYARTRSGHWRELVDGCMATFAGAERARRVTEGDLKQ